MTLTNTTRNLERPLIAVSAGFTDYGDYLGLAYSRPLAAAGALPVMLPYLEDEAERLALLDRVDGVLLGFGRDIEPDRYGERVHASATPTSPHRDAFELALVHDALARDLPLLGICRGLQLLNVALGGTLYRDRSEYPGGGAEHPGGDWSRWDEVVAATLGRGAYPPHPSHPLVTAPGSRLERLLGPRSEVNSYHHQAVRRLGRGLVACAWAPDGVVEAAELEGAGFALAVQWELQEAWHADPGQRAIFEEFVQAAADRAAAVRTA